MAEDLVRDEYVHVLSAGRKRVAESEGRQATVANLGCALEDEDTTESAPRHTVARD